MDDLQVEHVAQVAAKAAVAETFLLLGMDVSTPEGTKATQDTFAHLRRSHAATLAVQNYGIKAMVTAIVGAVLALLWTGFLSKITFGR